jgi:transcriptional regulator with XRE-family HTH domain
LPNSRLRALIAQAGWTLQACADAVNALGREVGLELAYDRTTVAHWLAGVRPSATVAALAAEAFSRRLARPVAVEHTGLASPGTVAEDSAPPPSIWPQDPASRLVELAGTNPRQRSRQDRAAYRVDISDLPEFDALGSQNIAARAADPGAKQVGSAQIEAATLMLSVFDDDDCAFGGGHARRALSLYLAQDVAGWLGAPARPRVHRELFSVAGRLSYLAGWLSVPGVAGLPNPCRDGSREGSRCDGWSEALPG